MQSFDICDTHARVIVVGPQGTVEIPYRWGLAGPNGAWFVLVPPSGTSQAYIHEAASCLRRNRDVVTLRVERAA